MHLNSDSSAKHVWGYLRLAEDGMFWLSPDGSVDTQYSAMFYGILWLQ